MINILEIGFEAKIIIGVIVILAPALILKLIDIKLENELKFSREFIINAVFNVDPYYSNLIKELSKHPNIKYLVYYEFLLLLLLTIYYNLTLDVYIVIAITFSVYLIVWILFHILQYFHRYKERNNKIDAPEIKLKLRQIRHRYLLNRILYHYLIILGIVLIFQLMNSLSVKVYHNYSFDEILLLIFIETTIIIIPIILINYIIFLKNVRNKIIYINLAYKYGPNKIIIKLVLTSNITIIGKLCYINLNNLILYHDGFKAIICYKKIGFIERKI